MLSLLRPSRWLSRSWAPFHSPTRALSRYQPRKKVEEETLPDYAASRYYPAQIRETFRQQYQIVGKLAKIWSNFNCLACQRYDVKFHPITIISPLCGLENIYRVGSTAPQLDHELSMYTLINGGSNSHQGKEAVRSLLDSFRIDGPAIKKHECLVHTLLWENVWALLS